MCLIINYEYCYWSYVFVLMKIKFLVVIRYIRLNDGFFFRVGYYKVKLYFIEWKIIINYNR